MSSATLMNEIGKLSGDIAEHDDRIGVLREEMRSFTGDGGLALPADWDVDAATAELNQRLKTRHAANSRYVIAVKQLDAAQKEERSRELSRLAKLHKAACVEVLKAEIALGRAAKNEHAIREEAANVTGQVCGPLQHFGLGGSLNTLLDDADRCGTLAAHVREALDRGIVQAGDSILKGVSY